MAVTINEKIRFYRENDPYYYEVDNLPLIDLLANDKSLRDEINDILLNNQSWATEYYVTSVAQSAVGSVDIINISEDGQVLPNNVVDWVLSKNYITLDDYGGGGDPFIATKISHLQDVTVLGATVETGDLLVYDSTVLQSNNTHYGVFVNRPPAEIPEIPNTVYLENRYFIIGQEKPFSNYPSPDSLTLFDSRTQEETGANVLDSHHFTPFAHIDNTTLLYTKRFTRLFQDMGIPENATKIYGKFAVMQIPDPLSILGAEFHLEHAHSNAAPGGYDVVTDNPDSLNPGNAYHAYESIAMDSTSSNATEYSTNMCEFTIHYGNAITHPDDPSKNVLTFATVQNNSTVECNVFLYIYAYEV